MLAVQQLRRRMRFIGVALSYFVLSIAAVASAGASQAAGTRAPVLEDIRYLETIEEPVMREIRYLDKLVDELARGKAMAKILRG